MNRYTTWPPSRYLNGVLPSPIRNAAYIGAATVGALVTGAAYDRTERIGTIIAAPTSFSQLDLRVDRENDPLLIRVYKRALAEKNAVASPTTGRPIIREDIGPTADGWSHPFIAKVAGFIKSYNDLKQIQAGTLNPVLNKDQIAAIKEFYKRYEIAIPNDFDFQSKHAVELGFHIQAHGLLTDNIAKMESVTTEERLREIKAHLLDSFRFYFPKLDHNKYKHDELIRMVVQKDTQEWTSLLKTLVLTRGEMEQVLTDSDAFNVGSASLDRAPLNRFLVMNLFPIPMTGTKM